VAGFLREVSTTDRRNSSSLVIDTLYDEVGEENIAVACLYCDFHAQQEQTINNIVGDILKQLIGRGGTAKDLRGEISRGENGGWW